MISRVIMTKISHLMPVIRPSVSLLTKGYYYKSKMSIQEIKSVIEVQIKAQQLNVKDIQTTSKWFKGEGWTIQHNRTLVQLFKQTENYDIRLLSNIKSPQFQDQQMSQQNNQKQNADMNEVAICVNKKGQAKTMVIYVIVSQTFQITAINFVQNIETARQERLYFHNNYNYKGPVIETIPSQLFAQLSSFIKQELSVNIQTLQRLIDYCIESQQSFYIGWLKDLNRSF